jgi:hypothetical protein
MAGAAIDCIGHAAISGATSTAKRPGRKQNRDRRFMAESDRIVRNPENSSSGIDRNFL